MYYCNSNALHHLSSVAVAAVIFVVFFSLVVIIIGRSQHYILLVSVVSTDNRIMLNFNLRCFKEPESYLCITVTVMMLYIIYLVLHLLL